MGRTAPIARGLVLAAPLVIIFLILFSSADAVFSRVLRDALRIDPDFGDLPGRLVLAAVGAYLAIGLLAWAAAAFPPSSGAVAPRAHPRLGATEAATVFIVLDLLFGVFVALQAAYLFGGLDTMAAAGLTYAEYARRGFFELCAAVAIVGCVILSLEALVEHRRRPYVVAAVGLALLTALVLGSATMRLALYQQAYGWTELRFWVAAGIAWMAGGLIAAIVAVVTDRSRWLPHALVTWALAIGLVVNLIGPVRFVAEQNLARAIDPALVPPKGQSGLDASYLRTLDLDAVEPLVAALPRLQAPERAAVSQLLSAWRASVAARGPDAWQEWNLSRARARELLLRELPAE